MGNPLGTTRGLDPGLQPRIVTGNESVLDYGVNVAPSGNHTETWRRRRGWKSFHLWVHSPELFVVATDGEHLRDLQGVFKEKLHVLCSAQAGEQQVLGGHVVDEHVGDGLGFSALHLCLVRFLNLKDETRAENSVSGKPIWNYLQFLDSSSTSWKSHLEAITRAESADALKVLLKPGFYSLLQNYTWCFQLINVCCFILGSSCFDFYSASCCPFILSIAFKQQKFLALTDAVFAFKVPQKSNNPEASFILSIYNCCSLHRHYKTTF